MLELPNAEGREEQTLCPSEGTSRWQFSLDRLSAVVLPRTAALCLGLAGPARGFTDGEMASIVHDG